MQFEPLKSLTKAEHIWRSRNRGAVAEINGDLAQFEQDCAIAEIDGDVARCCCYGHADAIL